MKALLSVLKDKKALAEHRVYAAEALAWTGDAQVIPALLAVATSTKPPAKGEPDLCVAAVTSAVYLAPLGDGTKVRKVLGRLARQCPEAEASKGVQEGFAAVEKCAGVLACLAKLVDESAIGPGEAAAFALAYAKEKDAELVLLVSGMRPVASLSAQFFPRQLVIFFGMRRLGNKSSTDCLTKLDRVIVRDESTVRIPGARDLLGEERITAAILHRKE